MNDQSQVPPGQLNLNHVGMMIEISALLDVVRGDLEAIRGELVKVRQVAKPVPDGAPFREGQRTTVWIRLLGREHKVRIPPDATVTVSRMPQRTLR